jgi:hypothetical protein
MAHLARMLAEVRLTASTIGSDLRTTPGSTKVS